jgi:hypothetical protein
MNTGDHTAHHHGHELIEYQIDLVEEMHGSALIVTQVVLRIVLFYL